MRLLCLIFLLFCQFPLGAQDSLARTDAPAILTDLHDHILRYHAYGPALEPALQVALVESRRRLDSISQTPGDSLSYGRFLALSRPLQEATGDGHLFLFPNVNDARRDSLRARSNPLAFVRVVTGDYVLVIPTPVSSGDTLAAGTQVLRIEQRSIREVMDDLVSWRGLNDHNNYRGSNFVMGLGFQYQYQVREGLRDSIALTVRDSLGDREVQFLTRTPKPTQSPAVDSLATRKPPVKKVKKPRGPTKRDWDLEKLDSTDIWVLTIGTFNSKRLRHPGFKKLARAAFDTLNQVGATKLVIDVRANSGGRIDYVRELLRYLSPEPFQHVGTFVSDSPNGNGDNPWMNIGLFLNGVRKKDGRYVKRSLAKFTEPHPAGRRFRGDLVVLVGEQTFSAGVLFAHAVQANGLGTLIGRSGGGSQQYGTAGQSFEYPIGPNEEFELSMMNFRLDLPKPFARNLTPDIAVPIEVSHILDDVDNTMEVAREFLLGPTQY